jgi:hypothetical protein
VPTFGTQYDPAHFTAIPDPSYVDSGGTTKTKHPAEGTELLVVDADTLVALTPIVCGAYGTWAYTTTSTDWIKVSGDGGVTWVGPLQSIENKYSGGVAAAAASTALTNSQSALDASAQALSIAQSGAGGGEYEQIVQTAPGSYPAPAPGGTKPRRFVGQERPTLAQGRRNYDIWRNVVPPS